MGLLRQIPREDWRGADRVPEVHGLGSSRSIPWVRLSCRVVSSLADNTNRLILLLTRSLIACRENWLAGLYPKSHGIVGNQFYDREVAICNMLNDLMMMTIITMMAMTIVTVMMMTIITMTVMTIITMMVMTIITRMVRYTSRWAWKNSTAASTLSSTSRTSEQQATQSGGKRF